jgi:uroporphyrinogen-III synthase
MKSTQLFKNKRIVITRSTDQASELRDRLSELGAKVLELPLLRISGYKNAAQTADIFKEIGSYQWLIFTSPNGVQHFFKQFIDYFEDIRCLGMARIAVIGTGTAKALADYYLKADLIPEKSTTEGLIKSLHAEESLDNLRILVVTGNLNREDLVKGLEKHMAIVDQFQVYQTEMNAVDGYADTQSFREEGADVIVFASSSAAKFFRDQAGHLQLGPKAHHPKTCSMGPQTSAAMKELGIPVAAEAKHATIEGIMDAIGTVLKS